MADGAYRSRSRRAGSTRQDRSAPPFTLSLQALALSAYLAAAVILGGASAAGPIQNLLLQLIAILLAFLVVLRPAYRPLAGPERSLLLIGVAFVVVALLQLVPLPPGIWTALPNREAVALQFQLLGEPLPWLPISLNPTGTTASLLGLTIVVGTFLIVRRVENDGLVGFAWMIAIVVGVSVVVGFIQLAGGARSPLYLYSFTNRDQPVGFFANSNHLATLELIALPFLTALAVSNRMRDAAMQGQAGSYVLLTGVALLVLLGIVTNGSLAGLGLLLPTLIGCFFLFRGARSKRIALVGFGIAIALVVGFFILALNSPILTGFAATSLNAAPTSRLGFIRHSFQAVHAYFPLGSGLGSFTSAFPAFEDAQRVESTFVNHAHNDYLELLIELGLPGAILIVAFLAWWSLRVIAIWRDAESGALVRAATVASAVVLAHSLVDYPLRTAAIAAIFTACCAIMARPRRVPPPPPPVKQDLPAAKHLSA